MISSIQCHRLLRVCTPQMLGHPVHYILNSFGTQLMRKNPEAFDRGDDLAIDRKRASYDRAVIQADQSACVFENNVIEGASVKAVIVEPDPAVSERLGFMIQGNVVLPRDGEGSPDSCDESSISGGR